MASSAYHAWTHDRKRVIGLFAGLLLALLLLIFGDLVPGQPVVTRTAAVAVLMAAWWVTEAIPIAATALIPIALFPLLGITSGRMVAGTYFNSVIFLFIGGFIMALAMERWDLHKRIALRIVMIIGASASRLLLGFMVATAFLSMWISNTAAAMMMVPIALAIIMRLRDELQMGERRRFSIGLLIGIAYSASIGGTATLIGTPPNLAFSRIFAIEFPNAPVITFANWLVFGLPFAVIFLMCAWVLLRIVFLRGIHLPNVDRSLFAEEYRRLGRMRYEEKVVLILFVLLALLWVTRSNLTLGSLTIPGWSSLLPSPSFIDDGTVAIAMSLLLFVIPSREQHGERLMNWETAVRLQWGIVILFGGGFALAAGFSESGLSTWIAGQLAGLKGMPTLFLVVAVCTMLTFLTELTSNTATIQLALPLLGSLAIAVEVNPLLLMIPATLSASCAFMLPVATPPNAIVFGSGDVRIADMMRSGIFMNLLGILLITGLFYLIGLPAFNIDPSTIPVWGH